MKQINKTLYAFITFVLIWLIISLPNNTVFIENWDISGIVALFIYNAKDKTRGKIYWDESLYKYINEPFFNDRKYLFYNSYTNFEL